MTLALRMVSGSARLFRRATARDTLISFGVCGLLGQYEAFYCEALSGAGSALVLDLLSAKCRLEV